MIFSDKKIILGVTGGIAVYKSCGLLRELTAVHGADVQVIMTRSALEFMSPLVFETFSGKPVWTDMFSREEYIGTRHVSIAHEADAVLVCPATANIIGKSANGIADDLLSTVITAAGTKTIFAAAMESGMYENPIVQRNRRKLIEEGFGFIDPETGPLASGGVGIGRLAQNRTLIHEIKKKVIGTGKLSGKKVLVTAGPTHEWMDPVRFISNPSSGKMGFAVAAEAAVEGGEVTLISGPTNLEAPPGISLLEVTTAAEMNKAVLTHVKSSDLLVMSAAVGDYRPSSVSDSKMKKADGTENLRLEVTEDILVNVKNLPVNPVVVGFSVETDNLIENSTAKLKAKSLDLIIANDPNRNGAGFGVDTNVATIIGSDGSTEELEMMTKSDLARVIIDRIHGILDRKNSE